MSEDEREIDVESEEDEEAYAKYEFLYYFDISDTWELGFPKLFLQKYVPICYKVAIQVS